MTRIAAVWAALIAAGVVVAIVAAQSGRGGHVIEIRVWERADDPARNYVSARVEGGSWRDLGTVPVSLDGRSGAYRYGDISLTVGGSPYPTAHDLARDCSFDDHLDRVRAATVRVDLPDGSSGTAFHIGSGVFITAAHVVDGYSRVMLRGDNYSRAAFVDAVVGPVEWGEVDAARLSVYAPFEERIPQKHPDAVVHLANDGRRDLSGNGVNWRGDHVAIVGYPAGSVQRTVRATIWSNSLADGRRVSWDVTSERQVAPGFSGGPVVDACGRVRAIVNSGIDGPSSYWVRELLYLNWLDED